MGVQAKNAALAEPLLEPPIWCGHPNPPSRPYSWRRMGLTPCPHSVISSLRRRARMDGGSSIARSTPSPLRRLRASASPPARRCTFPNPASFLPCDSESPYGTAHGRPWCVCLQMQTEAEAAEHLLADADGRPWRNCPRMWTEAQAAESRMRMEVAAHGFRWRRLLAISTSGGPPRALALLRRTAPFPTVRALLRRAGLLCRVGHCTERALVGFASDLCVEDVGQTAGSVRSGPNNYDYI